MVQLGTLGGLEDCDRLLGVADGLLQRRPDSYDSAARYILHAVRTCASPDTLRSFALKALLPEPQPDNADAFQAGDCNLDDPTDLCQISLPLEAAQLLTTTACDDPLVATARIAAARPERTVSGAGSCLIALCTGERPEDALPLRWFCPSAIQAPPGAAPP